MTVNICSSRLMLCFLNSTRFRHIIIIIIIIIIMTIIIVFVVIIIGHKYVLGPTQAHLVLLLLEGYQ